MTGSRNAKRRAAETAAATAELAPKRGATRSQIADTITTADLTIAQYTKWFGDNDPRTMKVCAIRERAVAALAELGRR